MLGKILVSVGLLVAGWVLLNLAASQERRGDDSSLNGLAFLLSSMVGVVFIVASVVQLAYPG